MKRYKIYVSLSLLGCHKERIVTPKDLGYSDEEWEELTEKERDQILTDEAMNLMADFGWEEVSE